MLNCDKHGSEIAICKNKNGDIIATIFTADQRVFQMYNNLSLIVKSKTGATEYGTLAWNIRNIAEMCTINYPYKFQKEKMLQKFTVSNAAISTSVNQSLFQHRRVIPRSFESTVDEAYNEVMATVYFEVIITI